MAGPFQTAAAARLAIALFALALVTGAAAQESGPSRPPPAAQQDRPATPAADARGETSATDAAKPFRKLPADITTRHTLALPGNYQLVIAPAGAIPDAGSAAVGEAPSYGPDIAALMAGGGPYQLSELPVR